MKLQKDVLTFVTNSSSEPPELRASSIWLDVFIDASNLRASNLLFILDSRILVFVLMEYTFYYYVWYTQEWEDRSILLCFV